MHIYLIYKYTSPSNKSYIGQTLNLTRRIREHKYTNRSKTAFSRAIKKYGWNNLQQEILAKNLTRTEANILEEYYIAEHNTMAPSGYNLKSGGLNHLPTEEARYQLSLRMKGNTLAKGITHTTAQRLAKSIMMTGKPGRAKGTKHTEEQRIAKSIRQTGKKKKPYKKETKPRGPHKTPSTKPKWNKGLVLGPRGPNKNVSKNKGLPKQKTVSRISDRKEFAPSHWVQWIKRNPIT